MKIKKIVIAVSISSFLLFWLPFVRSLAEQYALSELRFSWYGLISCLTVLINCALLIYLSRPQMRSPATFWFSIFLCLSIIWGISEAMMRFSSVIQGAYTWNIIGGAGWIFVPAFFILFTLAFTGEEKLIYRPELWATIMLPAVYFLYLLIATNDIIDRTTVEYERWGIDFGIGASFGYFIAWFDLMLVLAVAILITYYRSLTEAHKRKQIFFFIVALMIPIITGSITEGLLPLLDVTPLLPGGLISLSFASILISYAISRYGLFVINPATVADVVLDVMRSGVVVTDKAGNLLLVNKAASELIGSTKSRHARPLQSHFDPGDQKVFINSVLEPLNRGDTIKPVELSVLSYRHRPPQPVNVYGSSFYSDDVHRGNVLVLADITEVRQARADLVAAKASVEKQVAQRTRQLAEERARLRASINSLNVGFIITDPHGNSLMHNSALLHIMGKSDEADSSFTLEGLDTLLEMPVLQKTYRTVRKTGKSETIDDVRCGSQILRIFIAPIRLDASPAHSMVGAVILLEDVTETKVAERSKDEFFTIASHELRTPLTSIKGNASMLLEYFADQLTSAQSKEMVSDIYASSARLIEIVNDFLDLSKLEQGKMAFEMSEFNLSDTLTSVVTDELVTAKNKGIVLDSDDSLKQKCFVYADKNRVRQVTYNIIGNAIKFTDKGSVTVTMRITKTHAIVYVGDTGRGISLEGRKMLFHKFQQTGDSLLTRDTTRGTGLGLYISKLMTDSMGGAITLEQSTPGKGSTFSFSIPLATNKDSHAVTKLLVDTATGLTLEPTDKKK